MDKKQKCLGEHTEYQPADDEWFCPNCGAGVDDFSVDLGDYADCDKLHTGDIAYCAACEHEWTGNDLAILMKKKHSAVPCPFCKGTGSVTKSEQRRLRKLLSLTLP